MGFELGRIVHAKKVVDTKEPPAATLVEDLSRLVAFISGIQGYQGAADKLGVKKRAEVAVAAAAMFADTEPEEYLLASGGLPLDWAENAGSSPTGDEHRELYQPVKKQP